MKSYTLKTIAYILIALYLVTIIALLFIYHNDQVILKKIQSNTMILCFTILIATMVKTLIQKFWPSK